MPPVNGKNKHYFSGRSDNFSAATDSLSPADGRLDPEGIRVSYNGKRVYLTDEYGPYVYEFNRESGRRTRVFELPSSTFAATTKSAMGATEIAGNTRGRVANKGMEGLAISPDGSTLFAHAEPIGPGRRRRRPSQPHCEDRHRQRRGEPVRL